MLKTQKTFLVFRETNVSFAGFSYFNYAADLDKRRSITPTYIFTIGGAEELKNWAPIYYYIFNHQGEIYGNN